MLGDIVHNEDVIKEIAKSGVQKISRLTKGKNKILLIRAHGAGQNTFNKAFSLGYKIVDATCPRVKEIHKIAKQMEQQEYSIIIIGDKRHDEVRGIIGQLTNKAIVIDKIETISLQKISQIKKAAVLCQSTQKLDKVIEIVKILKRHIKKLQFFNTICRPTRIKQEEIKHLPLDNDVMIIIGSKTSANTRRLFEISKSLNPRSFWVQSKKDIKSAWFKNINNVAITSGASTPDWITQDIIEEIKNITSYKPRGLR